MSVILEFSIDGDEFVLGRVLSAPDGAYIELERIVPTGTEVMPFVWVTGVDFEAFEERVRDSPHVKELLALDKVGDSGLYRIEWGRDHDEDLIQGIAASEATVLEATGDERWVFRLRFADHDRLSEFHNFCTDHGIAIHVERTYTLTDRSEPGYRFGLSEEQREALVLGLRRGYFATPKETGLGEMADELGITRQALSNRIRRGNEKVLRETLLSSVADR